MTPEGRLTGSVIERLRRYKRSGLAIWWLKLAGSPLQRRGMPDLLVVLDGFALFVELKAPGGEPTPLQQHRIKELEEAHAACCVCRSVEEFELFIESQLRRVNDAYNEIRRRRDEGERRGP